MGGGFLGVAESLDRDNKDRSDSAIVTTDTMGNFLRQYMSEDEDERFEEVVTAMSNTGAHELGHILGLEHATDIDFPDEINVMISGGSVFPLQRLIERSFGDRNTQLIGFTNSIDMLLRNIGSGTLIGE